VRATAPQLSDIACRLLHTLHINSVIALTQFPGDMPPASCILRAADLLLRNIACAALHVATEHACQHSPLTLAQRSE
jgi:hypothetical protein